VRYKLLFFCSLFSIIANAEDVSEFTIRGISAGMSSNEACNLVAPDFPQAPELYEKVGSKRFGGAWHFSVREFIHPKSTHNDGCDGSFDGYDNEGAGGAMTWSDSIDIKASNKIVYKVRNNQTLAAGDTIESCHERRQGLIDSLVSKYGKPTYMHDKGKKNKDYRHLIWDYSSTPSAREGDDGYEIYQFYAECEMYSHDVQFARILIQTELHSGVALQQAKRDTPKVKATIKPNL